MPQPVPCPQKAPEPLSESDQLTDTYKAPFLRLPDTSLLLFTSTNRSAAGISSLSSCEYSSPISKIWIGFLFCEFFQWFQFLKHMHLKSKLFSASDHLHKVSRIICLLITDYKIFFCCNLSLLFCMIHSIFWMKIPLRTAA